MFDELKQKYKTSMENIAKENVIKKLQKQGIDHTVLDELEFNKLIQREKEILEYDTKKIGIGVGIGMAISLLLGF